MKQLFTNAAGQIIMNADGSLMYDDVCCCDQGCPGVCEAREIVVVFNIQEPASPDDYMAGVSALNGPITLIHQRRPGENPCQWLGSKQVGATPPHGYLFSINVYLTWAAGTWLVNIQGGTWTGATGFAWGTVMPVPPGYVLPAWSSHGCPAGSHDGMAASYDTASPLPFDVTF